MTDWKQVIEFYEMESGRTNKRYFELAVAMLELVQILQTNLDGLNVDVGMAMYNLMLWPKDTIGHCLHVGWKDGFYLMSFDAFETIEHTVSSNEVVVAIERILRDMQSSDSGVK